MELDRLGLPLPPENFPFVWELGDAVELRSRAQLEARAAILTVVLARVFGMPAKSAMSWLLDARLVDQLTAPEWHFVASGDGDTRAMALHAEALAALGWLLSLIKQLDPTAPGAPNVAAYFPHLAKDESFSSWQGRTLAAPRDPRDAAVALDLYYCLDWAYLQAEAEHRQLPGVIDSNAIGQRRWAFEWAVMLYGPHHDNPPGWEEVDLST
jgi:hypothetical protein